MHPQSAGSESGSRSTIRGGVAHVGFGSLVSAGAIYVVLLVASRTLPVVDNTALLTWLAAFQLGTGLLAGLTTELTRATAAAGMSSEGPSTVRVGSSVGVLLAAALLATAVLWAAGVLGREDWVSAGFLSVGLGGFAVHAAMAGGLSGLGAWKGLGRLLTLEAVVKLLLVLCVAMVSPSLPAFSGAIAVAAFSWLALAPTREGRAGLLARTDLGVRGLAPRLASAVGAQGASAVLTVGFPLLLAATTAPAVYASSAPLLLAISLTRAPLMIPLGAFQSMAIRHFVSSKGGQVLLLLRMAGLILSIGLAGGAAAWAVGPWLMEVLFTYHVSGQVLGALTLAAAVLATLTLAGALCQAANLHAWFLAGWLFAVLVSVAVLLLPMDMAPRTLASLVSGPLTGAVVMAAGLARGGRTGAAPEGSPNNAAA